MKPLESFDLITRPSEGRTKKPKYIIFSEGYVTEPCYFTALRDHIRSKPSEVLADVVVMQRYMLQIGFSDPLKILELVSDYLHMLRTGEYSKALFVGKVVESVMEANKGNDLSEKELSDKIEAILKEKRYIDDNGNVRSYRAAASDVMEILAADYHVNPVDTVQDDIEYDEDIDIICVVVDRDADSRLEEQYRKFLARCDENGYLAYVTNPRFELWLLLHHDIGEYMDAMKQPLKLKTTIRQLMDRFGIDGKDVDCTALIPKIPLAVEQVQHLCTDLSGLEGNIGSNLGELMMKLGVDKPFEQ